MKSGKILSILSAAALVFSAIPSPVNSFAANTHTVTLLDFDGNVMEKLTVADGAAPDLDSVDTSSLEDFLDNYTQIGFYAWSEEPKAVTKDITIQALYQKMTLSLESMPERTEYYSPIGDISLDGLKVTITVVKQTPEKNSSGQFITTEDVVDISDGCSVYPPNLRSAFLDADTATIYIYPVVTDKAIASYQINLYQNLGDADMNGSINAADASYILQAYTLASTGHPISYQAGQKKRMDIDRNGSIEASDASLVLQYYAIASTVAVPDWDTVLYGK